MIKLPPDKVNVLWISDVPGWAYSNVYEGLTKITRVKFTNLNIVQCFHDDLVKGEVDPNEYDIIMLWAWVNVINQRSIGVTIALQRCPPDRTIVCVASAWAANLLPTMTRLLKPYRYFAGANQKVTDILRESLPWTVVENLEHGVDIDKFRPAPFPEIFTVGWAGNQNADFKRYLMAEMICREAKIPLKIAGHKSTVKYIPSEKMPEWYNGISVLLITSITEVHPLIYYEAASSGRPTVSTLVGDLGYGRSSVGIFHPIDAPYTVFVESLKRLKDRPSDLTRLGLEARTQVVKHWDWNKIAPNYVQYIMKVKNHAI